MDYINKDAMKSIKTLATHVRCLSLPRYKPCLPLMLTLVLVGALCACTPVPSTPMRVGTNVWPGYEPLYLARSLAYFTDQQIRLVELSSATKVIHAFRNGAIDVAALTLDETLLLAEHDADIRVIAIMDFSHGGDALLGQAHIRSLADIKGRRVGVENTALGAYMLSHALQLAHLSPQDVQLVPLEIDRQEQGFIQQDVDALITFEPVRSKLLQQGAHVLFSSAQIPGKIMDVMVVRKSYLGKHLAELAQLLQAWFKALERLEQQPLASAKNMATREQIQADVFLASLQNLRFPSLKINLDMFAGDAKPLRTAAHNMTTVMQQQGLLQKSVDISQLFNALPLQSVQP